MEVLDLSLDAFILHFAYVNMFDVFHHLTTYESVVLIVVAKDASRENPIVSRY